MPLWYMGSIYLQPPTLWPPLAGWTGVSRSTVLLEAACCLEMLTAALRGPERGEAALTLAAHCSRLLVCVVVFPYFPQHGATAAILCTWCAAGLARCTACLLPSSSLAASLRARTAAALVPLGMFLEVLLCYWVLLKLTETDHYGTPLHMLSPGPYRATSTRSYVSASASAGGERDGVKIYCVLQMTASCVIAVSLFPLVLGLGILGGDKGGAEGKAAAGVGRKWE